MRKLFSIMFSAILLLLVSAQGTRAQKVKVYDSSVITQAEPGPSCMVSTTLELQSVWVMSLEIDG